MSKRKAVSSSGSGEYSDASISPTQSDETETKIQFTEKSTIQHHQTFGGHKKMKASETTSSIPNIPDDLKNHFSVVLPNNLMAQKMESARPYNFFLTTITSSPETHSDPQFVTFLDLFDPSLGKLKSTVQINQNVDFEWLMAQYKVAGIDKLPLVVIYNAQRNVKNIETIYECNLIPIEVIPNHNSKIMILSYEDNSMRIVVLTANLHKDDWDNRVQGLWISDNLPSISDDTEQGVDKKSPIDSITKFRSDLIEYLNAYNMRELKLPINRMRRCDFSSVRVFLITSRPVEKEDQWGYVEFKKSRGRRYSYSEIDDDDGEELGEGLALDKIEEIFKLGKIVAPEDLPLVIQCPSLGNYGDSENYNYLTRSIMKSFDRKSLRIIYPSTKNVKDSYDGVMKRGCGCLFYLKSMYKNQTWIKNQFYQWKSDSRFCTKAIPNIKSYSCFDSEKLYWFMLTTHNASKSAWGYNRERDDGFQINNYEVGVAFCPQTILSADYFPLKPEEGNQNPIFKLPFDAAMESYAAADAPFLTDEYARKF